MIDGEIKEQFIQELEKSGNIYRSCLKVGIHRATFYRWKNEDDDFRKKADEAERIGRANNCDIGEHFLMVNVRKGDISAIKYLLSHNSPIYSRPMAPNIQLFENVFPGEGFSRYQTARLLKDRFREMGGIPLTAGGAEISDAELEKFEPYIWQWFENAKHWAMKSNIRDTNEEPPNTGETQEMLPVQKPIKKKFFKRRR